MLLFVVEDGAMAWLLVTRELSVDIGPLLLKHKSISKKRQATPNTFPVPRIPAIMVLIAAVRIIGKTRCKAAG